MSGEKKKKRSKIKYVNVLKGQAHWHFLYCPDPML